MVRSDFGEVVVREGDVEERNEPEPGLPIGGENARYQEEMRWRESRASPPRILLVEPAEA